MNYDTLRRFCPLQFANVICHAVGQEIRRRVAGIRRGRGVEHISLTALRRIAKALQVRVCDLVEDI